MRLVDDRLGSEHGVAAAVVDIGQGGHRAVGERRHQDHTVDSPRRPSVSQCRPECKCATRRVGDDGDSSTPLPREKVVEGRFSVVAGRGERILRGQTVIEYPSARVGAPAEQVHEASVTVVDSEDKAAAVEVQDGIRGCLGSTLLKADAVQLDCAAKEPLLDEAPTGSDRIEVGVQLALERDAHEHAGGPESDTHGTGVFRLAVDRRCF